MEYGFHITLC